MAECTRHGGIPRATVGPTACFDCLLEVRDKRIAELKAENARLRSQLAVSGWLDACEADDWPDPDELERKAARDG